MAVKRYNGTSWDTVAGKGDQGTSSSIATWVKTASGGETSLSGNDDNSQPLSYTVGQELVFINGALQKRGADYTATTGNSITGLTALIASDVVTVWTVNAFSVTNAISNTLVDAKGDLVTATGADVPARLAVGANDTVLTADSSTATGLKWAAPTAGGKVLQVVYGRTTTQSASSSGSYADTNLTATITPTSSSSSILVLVSQNGLVKSAASSNNRIAIRLNRGATALDNFVSDGLDTGTALLNSGSASYSYLDSPATTSATTYKTQFISNAGTATVYCQYGGSQYSSITLLEIGA
jgi:hypothetical protein